jgi:AraC-like DNA-binding protein
MEQVLGVAPDRPLVFPQVAHHFLDLLKMASASSKKKGASPFLALYNQFFQFIQLDAHFAVSSKLLFNAFNHTTYCCLCRFENDGQFLLA